MFDDLFTTYSSLDPPPIERKKTNLTDLDLKEINPDLYKSNMVATIDSPDINWSFDQYETSDPFSFKTDEPYFDISDQQNKTSTSNNIYSNNISTKSSSSKFSSKKDFVSKVVSAYKKVLTEKGLDQNYAYILTAQDALESGWGKHQAGAFNLGGIKGGNSTPKETFEYINGVKTKIKDRFRSFSSLEDYCNYKVNLMSNKRYNIFKRTSANNPLNVISTINNSGYSTTPTSQYSRVVMGLYNQIMNLV